MKLATNRVTPAAEAVWEGEAHLTTPAPGTAVAFAPAEGPLCFGTGMQVVLGKGDG